MKTIREIAAIATVSPGTVDRVIHNRSGVSPKTRARILELLEKYKYERNLIASTLAMKKKYVIASLIPSSSADIDFWELPKQGILEGAKSVKDYGISLNPYFFDQFDAQSYMDQFEAMIRTEPDAVLLAPIFYEQTQKMDRILSKKSIPFVFINIDLQGMHNISFIGQNSYQGGVLAGKLMGLLIDETAQILIARKERKINNHNAIENRIKGFRDYFSENKSNSTIHQIEISGNDTRELDNLTKTLLKNHLIKGIFVPSSFVNTIAKYIRDFELQDIKLIGFDFNKESTTYLQKDIINFLITQKPFDQGYRGIKVLADYLLFDKKPEAFYYAPLKIITKENVDYYKW